LKKKEIPHIKLKRVYDKPLKSDGYRVLVDRLWPRGLSKEKAALNEWSKELAPTHRLRNWFDHDPDLWEAFSTKYKIELNNNDLFNDFVERLICKRCVTLLYATTNDQLTHAIVLKEVIEDLCIKKIG
jgi:uncharacterized protein YeaO (DUF488 family)